MRKKFLPEPEQPNAQGDAALAHIYSLRPLKGASSCQSLSRKGLLKAVGKRKTDAARLNRKPGIKEKKPAKSKRGKEVHHRLTPGEKWTGRKAELRFFPCTKHCAWGKSRGIYCRVKRAGKALGLKRTRAKKAAKRVTRKRSGEPRSRSWKGQGKCRVE